MHFRVNRVWFWGLLCGGVICHAWAPNGYGQNRRQQQLELRTGWNSVWLEVNPVESDPTVLFEGLPIEIVACHFPIDSPVQFISDPLSVSWNREGWGVWYRPERADAMLSTLHAIYGQKAYLILATEDFQWSVTGEVTSEPIRWKSRSFNLQGLPVDPDFRPTFAEFFAGSSAHQPLRIYRLVDGRWMLLADPGTASIKPGEAYWIYAKESSAFQGPVALQMPYPQGVFFPDGQTTARLFLKNATANPLGVQVTPVSEAGVRDLSLSVIVRGIVPGEMSLLRVPLEEPMDLPALEAGEETAILFEVHKEAMVQRQQTGLLRVATDAGTLHWVPVAATRDDLPFDIKAASTRRARELHPARGLWVGQVALDEVNEVAVGVNEENQLEAPNPEVPTPARGVARLRLILHVDDDGVVRLLKGVAIVRRSEEDPADVALVTDHQLYPEFESVDIPQRIASAAYDFSALGGYLSARMANAFPVSLNAKSPAIVVAEAAADAAINNLTSTIEDIATAAQVAIDPSVALLRTATIDLQRSGLTALGLGDRLTTEWDDAGTRSTLASVVDELAASVFEARQILLSKKTGTLSLNTNERAELRDMARRTAAFAVERQAEAWGAVPLTQVELEGRLEIGALVRGDLFLGAAHPSNPYRHKYHPDHASGFDVHRKILLEPIPPDAGEVLQTPAGYGVDRISGRYSEEIFGLHKPLGPAQDLGLRVEGTFTLNRISLIGRINE
jgi:hypothetical protein